MPVLGRGSLSGGSSVRRVGISIQGVSVLGGSSGSSGRVEGRAEKHEIYAAEFGGHLFYDLFLQGRGSHGPPRPPLDPLRGGAPSRGETPREQNDTQV